MALWPLQLVKLGLQREMLPLLKPVAELSLRSEETGFVPLNKGGWVTTKCSRATTKS